MPWKEICPMNQRVAMIADWLEGDWTVTELSQRYGISRKTAYKWIERYEADSVAGLEEGSRAPLQHGRAIERGVQEAIVALRRRHPTWGPKKLRAILLEKQSQIPWPAASTMGEVLRREGLSQPRRRRRYIVPLTQPLAAAHAPNEVWTA